MAMQWLGTLQGQQPLDVSPLQQGLQGLQTTMLQLKKVAIEDALAQDQLKRSAMDQQTMALQQEKMQADLVEWKANAGIRKALGESAKTEAENRATESTLDVKAKPGMQQLQSQALQANIDQSKAGTELSQARTKLVPQELAMQQEQQAMAYRAAMEGLSQKRDIFQLEKDQFGLAKQQAEQQNRQNEMRSIVGTTSEILNQWDAMGSSPQEKQASLDILKKQGGMWGQVADVLGPHVNQTSVKGAKADFTTSLLEARKYYKNPESPLMAFALATGASHLLEPQKISVTRKNPITGLDDEPKTEFKGGLTQEVMQDILNGIGEFQKQGSQSTTRPTTQPSLGSDKGAMKRVVADRGRQELVQDYSDATGIPMGGPEKGQSDKPSSLKSVAADVSDVKTFTPETGAKAARGLVDAVIKYEVDKNGGPASRLSSSMGNTSINDTHRAFVELNQILSGEDVERHAVTADGMVVEYPYGKDKKIEDLVTEWWKMNEKLVTNKQIKNGLWNSLQAALPQWRMK
jgi:hypothetical protein